MTIKRFGVRIYHCALLAADLYGLRDGAQDD